MVGKEKKTRGGEKFLWESFSKNYSKIKVVLLDVKRIIPLVESETRN